MRKRSILLSLSVLLTGCVDKDARDYASALSSLLNSYQQQLTKRIQTEQKFYNDSAEDFRNEGDINVHRSLSLEREERSREFIAEARERGRAPALSTVQQQLRDYAALDFDSTRRVLERETSAISEQLPGLNDLETKAKTVAALNKALAELAVPPSKAGQLRQLQAFVTGVKTEVDRLDCADLKKALDQATERKKALDARKKTLDAEPPDQKAKDQLQIDRLAKQIIALDATITGLGAQRKSRGCQ